MSDQDPQIPNPKEFSQAMRARDLQLNVISEKMSALEKKMERQERTIKELRIRLDSGSSQERLDDIVKYMENAFGDLDHVIQVSYDILQDGRWRVVAVHVMDDKGWALRTICNKSVDIENAFDNVDIVMSVLHKDEVRDEHLAGTNLIFSRARA